MFMPQDSCEQLADEVGAYLFRLFLTFPFLMIRNAKTM